jgi:NitT/TauT family transport system substrate-binding protein
MRTERDKFMAHYRIHIVLLVLAAVLALTACSQSTQTQEAELTPIRVQLSWVHSIEFAGFYEAETSYYAEEGLDVTFLPAFDSEGTYYDAIEAVTSGSAEFGVLDAGALLAAREAGAKIVAIGTIYQRSPLAFTSLAEENITRPEDLVGKTVMFSFLTSGVSYQAMLSSAGVDAASVNAIDRTDYSIAPLLDGRADVIDGWVINEIVALEQEGHQINIILVSDYGVEMYPNVIFTTEDLIASNPDLVLRFLRATVRGMQDAVDNPEEAVRLTASYDPTLDPDVQLVAMQRSLPLLKPAGSVPGAMTDDAWTYIMQTLTAQEILTEPLDVTQAYTLQFLNEIYGSR